MLPQPHTLSDHTSPPPATGRTLCETLGNMLTLLREYPAFVSISAKRFASRKRGGWYVLLATSLGMVLYPLLTASTRRGVQVYFFT